MKGIFIFFFFVSQNMDKSISLKERVLLLGGTFHSHFIPQFILNFKTRKLIEYI